ncbi:DUF3800 domain-containing protein [Actinocrispum wychmicini]|nr:DUF3800 domain-containing protein [Actinocrispum wychmicini]
MEIACDESGSEGDNLIGGVTDVFAHASVHMSVESAAACVQEIRDRIRSPALEYKANHLLREKHRRVLLWLLDPAGPVAGHAWVHLTEKSFFLLGKVTELLGADEQTRDLYDAGPRRLGRGDWEALLKSFNDMMRRRNRDLVTHPNRMPTLDLLVPAIVRAVEHWGAPVTIVHDQQNLLTPDRVARLKDILGGRLIGLRLVDSRSDARVQIADFLAGVARKVASIELNGDGDPELTALLRPYVDPRSVWGDARSGRTLVGQV